MNHQNYTGLKALLIAVASITLVACSGGDGGSSTAIYTTVFDAGSSGTRLSFFKVTPASGGYPVITKLYEKEYDDNGINDFLNGAGTITLVNKDGINVLPNGQRPVNCTGGIEVTSGLKKSVESLGQSDVSPCVIEPLLLAQDATLSANNLSRSGVVTELFATAGMRTEESRNGGSFSIAAIEQYYQLIKTYVGQMGFATGEFKTINGNKEEGVWTWINLNDYYYNIFGGNPTKSPVALNPVGDFEVGGSSMQIAFPTSAAPSDAANTYAVSINGKSFNVYSKTFLGLGGDDARKYVRAYGYGSQNGGLECFATGATVSNTQEDSGISLYPSTALSPNIFPSNAVTTSPWFNLSNLALNLTGNPSFSLSNCGSKYDTVIGQVISLARNNNGTLSEGATTTWSSFKAVLQTSQSPFVGIDNFFFTAEDLNVAVATGFDKNTFVNNLTTKCSATISGTKLFQQAVCANGSFMNTYLFGTNGLFTNSTANFSGVLNPKENGTTVLTWTRGYLLQKYSR